jgi:hypothetical protein
MTTSQRLAEVRNRLLDWLANQAPPPGEESFEIVGESILMVDDFYAGRRFDAGHFYAVWFMEEDELKIHTASGDLLCVYVGDEKRFELTKSDCEHADVLPLQRAGSGDAPVDEASENIRRAA